VLGVLFLLLFYLLKKEKKEKKLGDVTRHIFAQTTHVALAPPKLSCGVGSLT